jgi:hypothetical protein
MSDTAEDLDALTFAFRDLEVTVRPRRAPKAAAGPVERADSFELVEAAPDPPEQTQDDALVAANTAALLDQFDLPELRPLARRLRTGHPEWTANARIHRAYRAGILARRRLEGERLHFETSLEPPARVQYYVVLRGPGDGPPFWTSRARTFFEGVRGRRGERFDPAVICQGLPSVTETDAFLLGAQAGWPAERP